MQASPCAPGVSAGSALECTVAGTARHLGRELPVYAITLGNADPALPAAAFFGGVHGLERTGARVVISFLDQPVARLAWDAMLHDALARVPLREHPGAGHDLPLDDPHWLVEQVVGWSAGQGEA